LLSPASIYSTKISLCEDLLPESNTIFAESSLEEKTLID